MADFELNQITQKQKYAKNILLVFVIFIGVASLAFGYFGIKRSINDPYDLQLAKANLLYTGNLTSEPTQDTDGDGLFDSDELQVYGTSPYLEDSDSDGIADGVEIENGTDPNCPEDTNCSVAITETTPVEPTTKTEGTLLPTNPIPAVNSDPKKLSVEEIRKLLKDNGMAEDTLAKITDEQLVKVYEETLSSMPNKQ